jgi:hypothetical protein
MRTMYDSTNINDIPSNASMVAGYVDGLYANVGNLQASFPACRCCSYCCICSHQ